MAEAEVDKKHLWGEFESNGASTAEPDYNLIADILKKAEYIREESEEVPFSIPSSSRTQKGNLRQPIVEHFDPILLETIAVEHKLRSGFRTNAKNIPHSSGGSSVPTVSLSPNTSAQLLKTSVTLLTAYQGFTEAEAETVYVLTDLLNDCLNKVSSMLKLLVERQLNEPASDSKTKPIEHALSLCGLGSTLSIKQYYENILRRHQKATSEKKHT